MRAPKPPLLLLLGLAACGEAPTAPPPIERRIESALMERLAAARGSDEGVVLADDTPRADVPEKPQQGSRLVFIRGASFHAPIEGLKGLLVAADDNGLKVRLEYGQGTVEITDATGAAAEREFGRLRKVGDKLWEEILGELDDQFGGEPAAKEHLHRWRAILPAWDTNYARRFENAMLLHRFALQAGGRDLPEEPEERYRDCRLMFVKREMIAAMGGGPGPAAHAVAAGPTVGIRRGIPGRDAEVRSALYGPDGMTVRIVTQGPLPEPLALEILHSFRPFAESRAIARRVAEREGEPIDAALSALSALHLDPTTDTAVQFLLRIAPLQPQRRELAEGLAAWLKSEGKKREQILAAAG
jgi:hypothetical protein